MEDYLVDEPVIEEITMTKEHYKEDIKNINKPVWEKYRTEHYYKCNWCGWEGHLGTLQTNCPEDDCCGKLKIVPFKERYKRDMEDYKEEIKTHKFISEIIKIEKD